MSVGRIDGAVSWDSFEGVLDVRYRLAIPLLLVAEVPVLLEIDHVELPIRRWSDLGGVHLRFGADDVDLDDGEATPVGLAQVRVGTVTAAARIAELEFGPPRSGTVTVTVELSEVERAALPAPVPDLVGVHRADVALGAVRVTGRGPRLDDARQAAASLFDLAAFEVSDDGATLVLDPGSNRTT